MFKYTITLLTLPLFISCSFKGTTAKSDSPAVNQNTFSRSSSIIDALSLKTNDVDTKTGILTLENGGESLLARLWFFKNAQRTLDIQYYSFAKDATGLIAEDYVVRAAERGVKVRILIDDAASRMYSHQIHLLDSHNNIEIRVYNAGLMLGRLDRRLQKLSKNNNRLLRRMHNKTVTLDDQVSILGGRNIADEYFDYDDRYNFRDRDVILIGKAVKDVKKSFEEFWVDTLTVKYEELSGKKKVKNENERFEKLHRDASDTKKFSNKMREDVDHFPEKVKAAINSGEFVWNDNVSFVSDKPGKNEDKKPREGGICMDSVIAIINGAKSTIDFQSPYFIMTNESKQLIKKTTDRGVKIRLLTNSLASIDNIEAFSGYQKDRKEILETGVQIYEFKPDAKVRYKLMITEIQSKLNYQPVYGFHSKTIVIDKSICLIGSYNFDPRSSNYNTECFIIIRSKKQAENLLKYIEEEFLPENSWKTTLDYNADKRAGIKKRIKAATRRIIPKKVL